MMEIKNKTETETAGSWNNTKSGMGTGIGNYRPSVIKKWVLGSIFFSSPIYFLYLFAAIAILAMFLPLCKVIEKLS